MECHGTDYSWRFTTVYRSGASSLPIYSMWLMALASHMLRIHNRASAKTPRDHPGETIPEGKLPL